MSGRPISRAARSPRSRRSTMPRPIATRRGPGSSRRRSIPRRPRSTSATPRLKAPFDGIVTARLVSLGELVGANGPTQLATIVQTAPIYVNFNINEQEVLNIRADMRRLGMTAEELKTYPIEVGLQTDQGYPYRGTLNYVSPSIDRATGTLAVRAILPNAEQVLVPGNFVRVRVGAADEQESLLVPDSALGSDQGGRYLLVLDNNNTVEQRKVTI